MLKKNLSLSSTLVNYKNREGICHTAGVDYPRRERTYLDRQPIDIESVIKTPQPNGVLTRTPNPGKKRISRMLKKHLYHTVIF